MHIHGQVRLSIERVVNNMISPKHFIKVIPFPSLVARSINDFREGLEIGKVVEHMDVMLVKHAFWADMVHFRIVYGDGVHGVPLVPDAHLFGPVDVPKEVEWTPEGVEGALHFGEVSRFEGLANVCAHLIVCLEDRVLHAFVPVPTLARAAFLLLVLGEERDAVAEWAAVNSALLFDVVVLESSLSIFF